MRERHRSDKLNPDPTAFSERHYSVKEIAEMWSLSPDTVRALFEHESGVLVLGECEASPKRRYRTIRIPESVLERVHRRMSRV
jgi:hypothetical protein